MKWRTDELGRDLWNKSFPLGITPFICGYCKKELPGDEYHSCVGNINLVTNKETPKYKCLKCDSSVKSMEDHKCSWENIIQEIPEGYYG